MESERPHRTVGSSSSSSSELFICFTSRLSSSSSMKMSSKSILSPGRSRDPPVSLSTSLSRRLKSNGSMKGGQSSPMFPTGSKKRGCAFDNPEPSSPKVTCIGQVRVKTKKQGKKIRTTSKRLGEVSFRKVEQANEGTSHQHHQQSYQLHSASRHHPHLHQQQQQQQQECLPHRNQRWVHLPLTICEALRAFGSEFSCLFPCRSSCFSTGGEREKEEKGLGSGGGGNGGSSSCGAVFARWLVALQEGEGEGKGREIELVVEDQEGRSTHRRQVGDEEIDQIKVEKCEVVDQEDEEARVSICIPPKNALLLMRCRSDPLRMSALANRFWDSPASPQEEEEDEDDRDNYNDEENEDDINEEPRGNIADEGGEAEVKCESSLEAEHEVEGEMCETWVSNENDEEQEDTPDAGANSVVEEVQVDGEENIEFNLEEIINEELQGLHQEKQDEEVLEVNQVTVVTQDTMLCGSSHEADLVDPENLDNEVVNEPKLVQEEEDDEENYPTTSLVSVQSEEEQEQEEVEAECEALEEGAAEKSTEEKETEETATQERSEPVGTTRDDTYGGGDDDEAKSKERGSDGGVEREKSVLPDCLLLMMCEPKLSMEVSKETWVCSTDFIRWVPEKQVKAKDGGDELMKKMVSTDSNPTHPAHPEYKHQFHQPPRSSCSFPAAAAMGGAGVSMATMIEQKLVNAAAYEPFVLTRCKSEPMRTAAAKLAPEACFWNNRKLEPHRPTTLGVGAAGIGF